jgi:hypothetical protein
MSKDSRDEALDKIQDVANFLLTRNDLPGDTCEYLRIIEALSRHRDLSHFLNPEDDKRLAKMYPANV